MKDRTAVEQERRARSVQLLEPEAAAANRVESDVAAACTVDDILADSFPASDPPPWTSGITRIAPARAGAAGGPRVGGPPERHADQAAGAGSGFTIS